MVTVDIFQRHVLCRFFWEMKHDLITLNNNRLLTILYATYFKVYVCSYSFTLDTCGHFLSCKQTNEMSRSSQGKVHVYSS